MRFYPNFSDYSLLEGDIIVYNDFDDTNEGFSGEAISNDEYKWPVRDRVVHVPYTISRRITNEKLNNITRAIQEYSSKTCVRYFLSIYHYIHYAFLLYFLHLKIQCIIRIHITDLRHVQIWITTTFTFITITSAKAQLERT